eukprot:875306-Pyramimonas_sp.AAC.1
MSGSCQVSNVSGSIGLRHSVVEIGRQPPSLRVAIAAPIGPRTSRRRNLGSCPRRAATAGQAFAIRGWWEGHLPQRSSQERTSWVLRLMRGPLSPNQIAGVV